MMGNLGKMLAKDVTVYNLVPTDTDGSCGLFIGQNTKKIIWLFSGGGGFVLLPSCAGRPDPKLHGHSKKRDDSERNVGKQRWDTHILNLFVPADSEAFVCFRWGVRKNAVEVTEGVTGVSVDQLPLVSSFQGEITFSVWCRTIHAAPKPSDNSQSSASAETTTADWSIFILIQLWTMNEHVGTERTLDCSL